eukprot:scaffold102335_cov63-Phaeocystis_antarctica.AAC.1
MPTGLSQSERARRARACTVVEFVNTPGGRNPTDTSWPLLIRPSRVAVPRILVLPLLGTLASALEDCAQPLHVPIRVARAPPAGRIHPAPLLCGEHMLRRLPA